MAAVGKIGALDVFGDDYPTPDGTCLRDYIHVTDLAEAHLLAWEVLAKRDTPIKVNLGTGRGLTVRQIIDEVERITKRKVPHVMKPRRPGDPPELYAHVGLAEKELGFRARRSDIEAIVSSAWPYFRDRR